MKNLQAYGLIQEKKDLEKIILSKSLRNKKHYSTFKASNDVLFKELEENL